MRLRSLAPGAMAAAVMLVAMPAHADWHTFWNRTKKDFRRVNSWPAPFEYVDRDNTRAPIQAMIAKGWQREHTLGSTYFDPETNKLTLAGQQKIQSILQTAPPEQRTIYVVRGERPEQSETRLASVNQTISVVDPERPANVLPTQFEPTGWSAAYINAIETKMKTSIPNPRLPSGGIIGGSGK